MFSVQVSVFGLRESKSGPPVPRNLNPVNARRRPKAMARQALILLPGRSNLPVATTHRDRRSLLHQKMRYYAINVGRVFRHTGDAGS
ncbi:MAG: hypothetical protein ABII26_01800 [Pseudomonadota bacterium]